MKYKQSDSHAWISEANSFDFLINGNLLQYSIDS